MSDDMIVSVTDLWDRLHSMEEEMRFNGMPYPLGMSCIPFRLKGQGFFPGGDGLWRDDAQIAEVSPGLVAKRGILFLGNDFGTCKSYERLRKRGFENPLTWKNVKQRVGRAKLPTAQCFFTNAVMGLRDGGTALDKKNWDAEPQFKAFCREFLVYQIEALLPQLIVVMGPVPKATLDSLSVKTPIASGRFPKIEFGSHVTTVFYCTHPYGDFNFNEERKIKDGIELREAWEHASSWRS
jgi:hypothetical protein